VNEKIILYRFLVIDKFVNLFYPFELADNNTVLHVLENHQ